MSGVERERGRGGREGGKERERGREREREVTSLEMMPSLLALLARRKENSLTGERERERSQVEVRQ